MQLPIHYSFYMSLFILFHLSSLLVLFIITFSLFLFFPLFSPLYSFLSSDLSPLILRTPKEKTHLSLSLTLALTLTHAHFLSLKTMASSEFPRFDVVSDESDHHFAGKPSKGNSTGAQKKIMQEWKLLDKNLPESIYVRVYETRTDLLRAAIVGAPGTPYHDGLFFFDVYFPSDYPTRPPLVFYRSFGFRVNPNLYADGKVCLSLLNTWNGKKCERWNPNNSNILQVPYFTFIFCCF